VKGEGKGGIILESWPVPHYYGVNYTITMVVDRSSS